MTEFNAPGPYRPRPKPNPLPHEALATVKRGDYVQMWFDTGAFGVNLLFGVVIESGPKAFKVRWESGNTNVIRRSEPRGVEPFRTPEMFEPGTGGELYWLEHLHGAGRDVVVDTLSGCC